MDKPNQRQTDPSLCVHCGKQLKLKGSIVKTNGVNRWVDRPHCETHGFIDHDSGDSESPEAQSQAS